LPLTLLLVPLHLHLPCVGQFSATTFSILNSPHPDPAVAAMAEVLVSSLGPLATSPAAPRTLGTLTSARPLTDRPWGADAEGICGWKRGRRAPRDGAGHRRFRGRSQFSDRRGRFSLTQRVIPLADRCGIQPPIADFISFIIFSENLIRMHYKKILFPLKLYYLLYNV
jgi:hypothetical protein